MRIDLTRPSTFATLNEFDLVVNCADTTRACPAALAEHCLNAGITFLETTADPEATWQIHERTRAVVDPRGTVILGVGLFPGISNLLARRVAEGVGELHALEVGVRVSPLSGAGPGTCALMAEALGRSARRYRDGAEITEPASVPGPVIGFPEGGRRGTIGVGLPESLLLHWSMGAPTTATYIATVPFFLRYNLRILSGLIPQAGWFRRMMLGATRASLSLMRSFILRNRATWVEIVALANRPHTASQGAEQGAVRTTDGFGAHAAAVAACVSLLRKGVQAPPGVSIVDEVFTLDSVVSEARRLSSPGLELAIVSVPERPHPAGETS